MVLILLVLINYNVTHNYTGPSSLSLLQTDHESELPASDIGELLRTNEDLKKLSREHKYRILSIEPNVDFSYPRTRCSASGSFRQFQPSWFKQYHYSSTVDGAFCRACAVFAPAYVGGHVLGQFVSSPFKTWRKMSQKASAHGKLEYHLSSLAKMSEFLARYENPSKLIDNILLTEAQKRIAKVVSSLFKVVLLMGKQGIAFRGHRDDCVNWVDCNEGISSNQGNFVELVRFRAETDDVLANHLKNSPRNARYTSKTIQNELIEVIGNHIRQGIIDEVKSSKFYTFIADDVSNKEQLSICLRYVHGGTVFVCYRSVERITGKSLADTILSWLDRVGLSPTNMRGQCYDGASNMSGARSPLYDSKLQWPHMFIVLHID